MRQGEGTPFLIVQMSQDSAELYLELGDWSQWNGSLRRANEAYTVVEALLLAEDEGDLLAKWLAQPMELPDERALWRSAAGLSREHHPVNTARYDVHEKRQCSKC